MTERKKFYGTILDFLPNIVMFALMGFELHRGLDKYNNDWFVTHPVISAPAIFLFGAALVWAKLTKSRRKFLILCYIPPWLIVVPPSIFIGMEWQILLFYAEFAAILGTLYLISRAIYSARISGRRRKASVIQIVVILIIVIFIAIGIAPSGRNNQATRKAVDEKSLNDYLKSKYNIDFVLISNKPTGPFFEHLLYAKEKPEIKVEVMESNLGCREYRYDYLRRLVNSQKYQGIVVGFVRGMLSKAIDIGNTECIAYYREFRENYDFRLIADNTDVKTFCPKLTAGEVNLYDISLNIDSFNDIKPQAECILKLNEYIATHPVYRQVAAHGMWLRVGRLRNSSNDYNIGTYCLSGSHDCTKLFSPHIGHISPYSIPKGDYDTALKKLEEQLLKDIIKAKRRVREIAIIREERDDSDIFEIPLEIRALYQPSDVMLVYFKGQLLKDINFVLEGDNYSTSTKLPYGKNNKIQIVKAYNKFFPYGPVNFDPYDDNPITCKELLKNSNLKRCGYDFSEEKFVIE